MQPKLNERIQAIDVLRGLSMILMALDHTRDFFTNFAYDPTDLTYTSAALFFTRWISHIGPPIFLFLIGTGMFLARHMGKSRNLISFFLLTRGLWMIFIEFTIVHVGWAFNFDFTVQMAQAIWVIGVSMILLAGLIYLPMWLIFTVGMTLLLGHNMLDGHEAQWLGACQCLYSPISVTLVWPTKITFFMLYSVLSWVAIPALGYVFGNLYTLDKKTRQKYLLILGTLCALAFIVLRFINAYGDPHSWSEQSSAILTFMSFLNTTKYPASLQYFLMTFSVIFYLAAILERYDNAFTRILDVYGKVPFFYYIVHLFIIHGAAVVIAYLRFGQASAFFSNQIMFSDTSLVTYGYSLPIVYLAWIAVVVVLYPMCKWYGGVKRRHKGNTLFSYI